MCTVHAATLSYGKRRADQPTDVNIHALYSSNSAYSQVMLNLEKVVIKQERTGCWQCVTKYGYGYIRLVFALLAWFANSRPTNE